jgi:autotransporter-associated beta strand protein
VAANSDRQTGVRAVKEMCRSCTRAIAAAFAFLALLLTCPPTHAQTNFATLATDGAWTWFNDPRAVFRNGVLYFGYNRAADGRVVLSTLNLQTGNVSNLWSSSLTETDDHDLPGLLVKQDGTMLAIYARHQDDQFFTYRLSTSTNPVAPADWGPELTNNTGTNVSSGMTYANPFQLASENGQIYNFARYLNYNPNVFTSTNGGATWSTPRILIQTGTGGTRPYVKYCSDYNQRLDFLYTDAHPDNTPTSLYHLFYQGGSFYKTDATFVKSFANLPLLHDSGERGSIVYQYNTAAQPDPNQWIPNARAWCWEIGYQTNGDPVCVFQVKVDNVTGTSWFDARIYYYYARWTGTAWQKRFIAQAGRPLYNGQPDYGGGICFDPLDPNTIYLSTDAASPFDLSTTTTVPLGANYQIWKGSTSDGGLTFSWQSITGNSVVDNLRPYVPRRFGGEPCVLWFRGTYTSYTSFNSSIVGLFTTAVPQSVTASGAWTNDADGLWSNASNWSDGIVADGAGNTADFSLINLTADRIVTLDSSRTIGTLKFGDTLGSQNWLLNAAADRTLTLAGGAPLINVNQNTATLAVPLTGTSGFTKTGAGTLILPESNSLSGTLNLDSNSASANDGTLRVTTNEAFALIASPIFIRNNTGGSAGSTLELDGATGDLNLTQLFRVSCRNNSMPWVKNLAGSNTLSGGVSYQEGGTQITYQSDAGALVLSGAIQFQPNGAFIAARTNIFTGAGDFFVNGAILAATNGAPIHLIKSGTGRLTLNGANTYAGTTLLNNGALRISGSLSTGTVTVASSGVLEGTGVVNGSVTILPGGTLSPGASIGSLTISRSLTNSGTLLMELNKNGLALTNDAIKGLNILACGGTLQLVLTGNSPAPGDSFHLFTATNYTGSFATITPSPGYGLGWDVSTLTVDGILRVKSIAPIIAFAKLEGANLVFGGTNGTAGTPYYVLSSTNVAASLANWTRMATNLFAAGGSFRVTNSISPGASQMFFVIQLP